MITIHLLGQFSIRHDSEFVIIPSRPAQSLFAYLVLNPGLIQRREKLAGMFWPDATEENARGYLRSALWRIRKSFDEADVDWGGHLSISDIEVSVQKNSTYELDADRILERKTNEDWSLENLERAVSCYAGELLPGFYDEWIVLERERIQAAYEQKMRLFLNKLLEARRWEEALNWSEQWITKGYAPEPAYRALMIAHAGMGDLSSAIAIYRRCQENLSRELGVEPSEELRVLREALTKGEMPSEAMSSVESRRLSIDIEPPVPGNSPYKGLAFFDTSDADLFFGRETLTSRLVGRLRESRFLALIVGASGSGKSSVVRAGLVPALQRGKKLPDGTDPPKGSSQWKIVIFTPGVHPLESLALAITRDQDSLHTVTTLIEDFTRDPLVLHLASRRLTEATPAPRLLLVIDQFEEVFTLCRDEGERNAFIDNVMNAVDPESNGPTTVVITLRADFYAHCSEYPKLREVFAHHQEYIGAMSTEELRRAIEQPARNGNWTFQPGLVDLLIRDARGEPGALPLLSHALLETWKRRSGTMMTLKGYAESGGVRGAIAKSAENVYRNLDAKDKRIARGIFIRLTELGVETQDTRRRAQTSELITSSDKTERVYKVLNTLAEARLVTLDKETAEVAHEALIREWPTLRDWLEEDRESLLLHRHLTTAAQEWETRGRDESELYRGTRLVSAKEWAGSQPDEINPLEHDFLDASKSQEEHEGDEREAQRQRELETAKKLAKAERERAETQTRLSSRLRLFSIGLSVLLLVAIAAAAFALQQRSRAESESHIAKARELAAAAVNQFEVDPELSIILALDAIEEAKNAGRDVPPQVEEALHQSVQASRLVRELEGHDWHVYNAAYSPDDSLIATASFDGTVRIWAADDGELVAVLDDSTKRAVKDVAFHPDGSLLATSSNDRMVRIWDTSTWGMIMELEGHTSSVDAIEFSPDGEYLASVDFHGNAMIWDHDAGTPRYTFRTEDRSALGSVAYSPNGEYLSAAGDMLYVWEIQTGEKVMGIQGSGSEQNTLGQGRITGLSFSPDGSRIGAADFLGNAKVFDAKTGELDLILEGHSDTITDIVFDPDGNRIATSSFDRRVIIWDAHNGDPILGLTGHKDIVLGLAFNSDGSKLVSTSVDGAARIWDVALKRELFSIPTQGEPTSLAFSPDGTKIAAGVKGSGATYIWDIYTGILVKELPVEGTESWVTNISYSPTGEILATSNTDESVRIWDATSGELIRIIEGHDGTVNDVEFSPDGERIASAASDSQVKIWQVETGSELEALQVSGAFVTSTSFHPTGKLVAGGNFTGSIMVWNIDDDKLNHFTKHLGPINELAFHPDGRRIASASADGTVIIWDLDDEGSFVELLGHDAGVGGLAFNQDGSLIASASLDGSIRVWQADTGEVRLVLSGATGEEVFDVEFSPDNRMIAATGPGGIHFFLTDLTDLADLASGRLFRDLTAEECADYYSSEVCKERVESKLVSATLLPPTDNFRMCEVITGGGAYDGGYSQRIHEGSLLVKDELGWDQYQYETDNVFDIARGIQTLLKEDCDLLLAPGFDYLSVIETEARNYPDQRFVTIDSPFEDILDNVWNHFYAIDQASFQAGYLAAGITQTGTVATFGGSNIPPVLDIMIGFEQGVLYYNELNGTDVDVLGWNSDTGKGDFVGLFCCRPEGRELAEQMIDQGADVLFPVAGSTVGEGALLAIQEVEDVLFIGVDVDQAEETPEYSPWILTSAEKRMDLSVLQVAEAFEAGTFSGGAHLGTLENGEVGLSPFHENDQLVSGKLKADLERIKEAIISGEIQTKP